MPNGCARRDCLSSLGLLPIDLYLEVMAGKFLEPTPTMGETRERMQRVRVGMTGLAAVGLVVLVATAVATGVRRSADENAAAVGRPVVAVTTPAVTGDSKSEPLAQLGVAPDADADDTTQDAPKQSN